MSPGVVRNESVLQCVKLGIVAIFFFKILNC